MSDTLRNLRVLDVSRVLAGPYCAQMLADQGADVIKVESREGDENRLWGARAANGLTCNFNSVNRGKRSIALNLKTEGARHVLRRLMTRSDVMIHSFLPETGSRLGIDYEKARAARRDIIFCSLSGYGEHGPLRGKPGYDLMMQAFSGMMSITGFEGGPPVRAGPSVIDMTTGMLAYGGIMTALVKRMQDGNGSWVRASLLETAISLLGYHAVTWLQAGVLPRKEGSGTVHLVPYQAFACSDGYLLAGATNDAAWRRFAAALGRAELADDERFRTNDSRVEHREVLVPLLEQIFASQTVGQWTGRFDAQGVAVAPIQTLNQVLIHPQVLANHMVVSVRGEVGGEIPVLGSPFKLDDAPSLHARGVPALGAHTDEILQELGYAAAEIQHLREQDAI